MTRYSTHRLFVGVGLSLAGALMAVLVGLPEVALFVAPWVVVCVLGLTHQQQIGVRLDAHVENDRLLVGDMLELRTEVAASGAALVKITPEPSGAFWSQAANPSPGATATVDATTHDPGERREIITELAGGEWGAHDVGGHAIEVTAPYGLFHWKGASAKRCMVRIHPTPTQLQELLTPWMVRRVSGTHGSKESSRGIEYADIREFAAGDSVRDINWRASARTGDLWVSQRHPDRATDVILLVDSFIESGHDVRTIFGLVVESAVALAESHLGVTDRVGLVEFGGVVRWVSPGTGRVQLQRLTDALLATGLYANAADKDLPILPSRALPPRSFIIAFSPLLDDRFVEAVFTARGRGHDVAVVECDRFDVQGEAEPPPSEVVTKRLWHAERAMLRDRMAEQGIAVASWDGDEHLDVALGQLLRRRRRAVRVNR